VLDYRSANRGLEVLENCKDKIHFFGSLTPENNLMLTQCMPGVHKFPKDLEATSKFLVLEEVKLSKFCTEDQQILSAILQNLVTRVT
jgi:hypothetical protein